MQSIKESHIFQHLCSMRMYLSRLLAAFTILLLALSACSTSECSDNQNSLPLAGFYSLDSTGNMQQVAIDSITIYGLHAPADSLLLNDAKGVSQVYLPFRINEKSTTFVLDYLIGSLADTISFSYDLSARFASAECGVVYDYEINKITHTHLFIDSVVCPKGVITNQPGENLRIYLRSPYQSLP